MVAAFYLSTDLPRKALDSSLYELLVEACISLPKKALDKSLYELLLEVCISLETEWILIKTKTNNLVVALTLLRLLYSFQYQAILS